MKKNKGFTLMELLIVIGIIGVLIAIALPRVQIATRSARSNADLANIRIINTQLELYNVVTGRYPTTPNLAELLNSSTYFPDGRPRCPFLNQDSLGTYSVDDVNIMRVTTRFHWAGSAGHTDFLVP